MKFYVAPMEGITGYIYRQTHAELYPGADEYYTPFVSPGPKMSLKGRDVRDVLPENNRKIWPVVQVLTNRVDEFLAADERLRDFGYEEINLNLGCPSGTVAAKFRGAGFLALPDELDAFLGAIFERAKCRISIKTRVGKADPGEIVGLVDIYNKYPLEYLIVHPRVQIQGYTGAPDMPSFDYAYKNSRCPVVYNGDIWTPEHMKKLLVSYPDLEAVMLGRGLIANPALIEQIKSGEIKNDKNRLREFHDRLLSDYCSLNMGDKNVLFRMKELWCYMIRQFPDSRKMHKAINKSQHLSDYIQAVDALFIQRDIDPMLVRGVDP